HDVLSSAPAARGEFEDGPFTPSCFAVWAALMRCEVHPRAFPLVVIEANVGPLERAHEGMVAGGKESAPRGVLPGTRGQRHQVDKVLNGTGSPWPEDLRR